MVRWLVSTMVLGAAFLGIKAKEYTDDYHEHLVPGLNFQVPEKDRSLVEQEQLDPRKMELFFVLYFFMTGLHAIHLIIGIALVGVMAGCHGGAGFPAAGPFRSKSPVCTGTSSISSGYSSIHCSI